MPCPDLVEQPLLPSMGENRKALHANVKTRDAENVNKGETVRRRRSASPRGVRQLQRECDFLVLSLARRRFEEAMRKRNQPGTEADIQHSGKGTGPRKPLADGAGQE